MNSLLFSPGQPFLLGASIEPDKDMPMPPGNDTDIDLIYDTAEEMLMHCNTWCWIYIIFGGLLTGFHLWMMIGPLHRWAEANFSLLLLTIWSLGSFALSLMYIMKVPGFFMMPKWVRRSTWVMEMVYSIYYFCTLVITIINMLKGDAFEETNIEIILAYLLILGFPAAWWGGFVTIIEGVSGDLSSEQAKKYHEE